MNILKRELKAGLKPFLFWLLGLFVLDVAGMTKYTGMAASTGADVMAIFESFPKIVLAMFGMSGADPSTLSGYFSIMSFFTLICTCIYALSLGINAVSREAFDKTYEFVFTKPKGRPYILFIKLLATYIYLVGFCLFNYAFSIFAIKSLDFTSDIGPLENISTEVLLFCAVNLIIGTIFFAVAVFFSVAFKEAEKGSKCSNIVFMIAFAIGVLHDTLDNPGVLVILTPLKYFHPDDLIAKSLDAGMLALSFLLISALISIAFFLFNKKDLSAT